jgi:glutamyl-tRNA synthetase
MSVDSASHSIAVRGRLAPSPTGAQHVGNARTFLLAWLSARAAGGSLVLRMEDIDSPRIKPWAAQQALDDLRWLGLDWDAGPDRGGPDAPYVQTERVAMYAAALERLKEAEAVYPCTCTRSDVEAAASAPHVGQEGPAYPGTCASRSARNAATLDRPYCWRFRMSGVDEFADRAFGRQVAELSSLGDFVVSKADGTPAYQLAVVVDDHAMEVTEVVRGADLLPSTFRQRALYRFFEWTPPAFAHMALVVGADGRRLAKRHGDTRLSVLREAGRDARTLIGFLAKSCGLIPEEQAIAPAELVESFRWEGIPREPLVLTDRDWGRLR